MGQVWSARFQARRTRSLYPLVASELNLSNRDTLLDVGCGVGAFTRDHASQVKQVFALDHSRKMIRRARRNNQKLISGEGAEFYTLKVEDSPWQHGMFTAISAIESMMYWKEPERALKRCFQVLSENGRMVVTLGFNKEAGNEHRKVKLATAYHLKQYSKGEAYALFERAGFRIHNVKTFDAGPITQGLLFHLRKNS